MSDQDRPKSSWQSWVRSTEVRRGSDGSAADRAGLAATDDDADLHVALAWDEAPGEAPDANAAPDSSWTTWPEADADPGDDDRAVDDFEPDDEVVVSDDHDDDDHEGDDDDDDHDGDGEFGELLPTVPLLPSIAGRVDALSGVLRSITHRVDGLSAATEVYRATVVDRIDQFTETVLEQGRRSDQSLDEYRRSTERTIGELRRGLGEQSDGSKKLLARVEEVASDVATLVHAQLVGRDATAGAAAGPAVDPAWVERIDTSLGEVAEAQQANGQALAEVQQLVAAIVDTMPASAEGSAADVAGALAGVEAALEALAASASAPVAAAPVAPPPPPPAPAPAAVIDDAMVATIADAIVDRLDLDALAMLVAEHLSATFEVIDEARAPEAPAPERRRKKG